MKEHARIHERIVLVGTMIAGSSEGTIGDACRSVANVVDQLILVDTGIEDSSLEIAKSVFGHRLTTVRYAWSDDFADARNAALRFARTLGGDWALTIDTDERIQLASEFRGKDLRRLLETNSKTDAWMVCDLQAGYAKERILRLSSSAHWEGQTHEAFVGVPVERRKVLDLMSFWEIPKSELQLNLKYERDLLILKKSVQSEPSNPRWWFYLGQTYFGLKDFDAAINALDKGLEHDDWDEQAAWSLFTSARCAFELKEFEETISRCCLGLAYQPNSPELLWLSAVASARIGDVRKAISWAEMAIVFADRDDLKKWRIGFQYPPAWFEGPHDVLRHAYKAIGINNLAEKAEADFLHAKAIRMSFADEHYQ